MNIQDEKNNINAQAQIKKDEIDRQASIDRQAAADREADRIRQEAEQKAQQIQSEGQNKN